MSYKVNMTSKDMINAKNASLRVCDYLGQTMTATGCAYDDAGEKPVGYITTNQGVFGFTSNVILKCLDDLCEILNEDGKTDIRFTEGRSNSGKTFYRLEVL